MIFAQRPAVFPKNVFGLLMIHRSRHFPASKKKAITGPKYMNVHPHRVPQKLDQDGVPVVPPDETPVGNENRPKRRMFSLFDAFLIFQPKLIGTTTLLSP